ncbi:MAG: restriction endonuclease subunit S [Anaerolineae bacterium]|nr:restriction endonuclease subunit S [Anaerolineae bacterium]
MIPAGWTSVKLKPLLQRVRKPVEVEAETLYREIGIRSHGKGIFYKEERTGDSLGDKSVFWIEPDCFIVNIVFAWEQAVAKTTTAEQGMIASHRFPMYRPKDGKLDLDFLVYFFKTSRGKRLLELASPGGAGRNKTLGQEAFLDLAIPLPPFPEQRAIAAILGTWDRAIALTERRLAAAEQRKKALMQQLLTGRVRFPEFAGEEWREARLKDIATINPPKPQKVHDDTLVSFIAMADVSENAQIISTTERPYYEVNSGFTSFQDEDILIAKITPCFENGKGAWVHSLKNGLGFGSTEFHVIRVHGTQADPEFIYYHTIGHNFRGRGGADMVGSAGQKRVRTDFVKNYKVMLPSLPEQRRTAAVLNACDRELDLLRRKRDALQQQKKGLMQRLLTGRVRVPSGLKKINAE